MDLFTPLSKDYCLYFYFLSLLGFILLTMSIVFSFIYLFYTKKQASIFPIIALISGYFLIYFQNRLLYGMCINAEDCENRPQNAVTNEEEAVKAVLKDMNKPIQ
jgi:hypothetical protein